MQCGRFLDIGGLCWIISDPLTTISDMLFLYFILVDSRIKLYFKYRGYQKW